MNLFHKIKLLPVLLFLAIAFFFAPVIFQDKLPVPSDTLLGLYHPWRDEVFDSLTAGVPYKNFLLTDPVRQQIPWRDLVVESLKAKDLPLWNPYNFSGAPLLANFQSAVFYPLNLVFFILPFEYGWSLLILLQPILAGLFMYLYLRNFGLDNKARLLASLAWIFSGFFISWLEWGVIGNTALWLPLILLSVEKIYQNKRRWYFVFLFSLVSQFFAGHLQTSFYLLLFSGIYIIARFWSSPRKYYIYFLLLVACCLSAILTLPQWLPTLNFINLSAREIDQSLWSRPDWFIPIQNLIQFIAPDFFGNPATLNYRGIFNYSEFVGFIGVLPLIFSLFAVFRRRDKKTAFFLSSGGMALLFALANPISKLPFQLNIPFIASAQPSRLLFIVGFSLCVLCALGFDYFLKNYTAISKKTLLIIPSAFLFIIAALWLSVIFYLKGQDQLVSRNNLIIPSIMAFSGFLIILLLKNQRMHNIHLTKVLVSFLIILSFIDLLRFGNKYTPFSPKNWFYPSTTVIDYLTKNQGNYRFMSLDPKIIPPNFSLMYRLQTIEGYDPLYLKRYAELISASERGVPNINPPFGFNRMITPRNVNSNIIDLLGVKYVLSLKDEVSAKLTPVFREGETRVYENIDVLPRAFLVGNIIQVANDQEYIQEVMNPSNDLSKTVIVNKSEGMTLPQNNQWYSGTAQITTYGNNRVDIDVNNVFDSILILTDVYYPSWSASIDGQNTKIYQADYCLRAIIVPKGQHKVTFKINKLI